MAKPHYRMAHLRDLKEGTHFWALKNGTPRTWWEGKVCYQCVGSTKVWVFDAGGPIYAGQERQVYVEVSGD